MEIMYKITIRFNNGVTKVKKVSTEKTTIPFLIMKLRSQFIMADIDWEGSDGSTGTTQLNVQTKK